MTEVIVNPEFYALTDELRQLKKQFAEIIEERDNLVYREAISIKTDYVMKIGELEYRLFELECDVARTRRKIEMIQACLNLEMPVENEIIEQQLDLEYEEYMRKLKKMAQDVEIALIISKCPTLTDEEVTELKKLYRSIAKMIHPDLNPDMTEDMKELWIRVMEAYERADIEMMGALREMASSGKSGDGIGDKGASTTDEINIRIEKMKKSISKILHDIEKIGKTFPFNQIEFLMNEQKVAAKRKDINRHIEKNIHVLKELSDRLLVMMPSTTGLIS